ncbi:MAG: PA14 domain-containing protein [Kiritimatiellae bacterium]|nr:PA14 domain-containing protein [Kiritimatiellia bacterium]
MEGKLTELVIEGQMRIQILSRTLIRIEEHGPKGFEDRPSFHIEAREWEGLPSHYSEEGNRVELRNGAFCVSAMGPAPSLENVRIHSADGLLLFDGGRPIPAKVFLPNPGDASPSWAFSDFPRIIPPPWGALPPPPELRDAVSGWDLDNQARDVFVFLPGERGYRQLVEDFLRLTGRTPMLPLCALGLIDSRYYPYRQSEALEVMDQFRQRNVPLDIFVLDTDWRVGASHGYGINTALIPDMEQFVRDAHARGVRIMLNDHPEPRHPVALSPQELAYRYEGLTSLLRLGVDYWWFDRNWHTALGEPVPGLSKEVWGMRLYHDIAQAHRPEARVLVMSNVEGVDNGHLNEPSSPAAHRFPIWWTGDTRALWIDLRRGVQNAVNGGVRSLLPYMSEDLGGHHDTPDQELYTRFVQYGALSPICRLHCSASLNRHPWQYGEAGSIAEDYIRLRYRLLPTLYAAAREAFDSGIPMVRRCDLEWPHYPEARSDTQYLLGADLLVAPIMEPLVPLRPISNEYMRARDGQPGLDAAYFNNARLEGEPLARAVESELLHDWTGRAPHPLITERHFSVRWTGELGPVPEGGLYRFVIRTNDCAQAWLDDELVIDYRDQSGPSFKSAHVELQAGKRYSVRIEYRGIGAWFPICELRWGRHELKISERSVWLPPGVWYNVWTGQAFEGPATIRVAAPLAQIPLFVRAGGVLFSAPLRQNGGEAVWSDLALDWFLSPHREAAVREFYEDDGASRGYLMGGFRKTRVIAESRGEEHHLTIEPARGQFGAKARTVCLRVHGLNKQVSEILLNGKPIAKAQWRSTTQRIPLGDLAARGVAAATPVLELDLGSCATADSQFIVLRT